MSLMLHVDSGECSREQLRTVVTPPPVESYFPIPHDTGLELVDRALQQIGVNVEREQLALSRNGQRFFGIMHLKRDIDETRGYQALLGMRNAHDKSASWQFVIGSRVFVCDNWAFSGDFKLARRHTKNIERDLPELIMRGVSQFVSYLGDQDKRLDAYRVAKISDHDADSAIVQLLRRQAINVLRVPTVVQEWYEPSHAEHAEDGKTVWRLFNAYTAALGGDRPTMTARMQLPKLTVKAHALFDEVAGFLPYHADPANADGVLETA